MSNFIELHTKGIPRMFNIDLIELVCVDPEDGQTLLFPNEVNQDERYYVVDETYEQVKLKIWR